MADRVPYNRAANILERRIRERIKRYGSPKDKRAKESLFRIGILLEREIKKNIQRKSPRKEGPPKGLIDTGTLFNSIRFRLFQHQASAGVMVGSFGVPYAAVHEFGFRGNVNIPEHQRFMNQAFGRPIDPRLVSVSAHTRFMNIPQRSFVGRAVRDTSVRQKIINILRSGLNGDRS